MCRWRHKIRKIVVEILQSVNNQTQCLRESAYYAWLLLTYVVINTILGRLTLDPAGMHCLSGDDAFVSSVEVFILCLQCFETIYWAYSIRQCKISLQKHAMFSDGKIEDVKWRLQPNLVITEKSEC